MLELKNVTLFYGAVRALDSVSMNVGIGEVVVLVGANGAGKSSLLRAVSGLNPISSGQIMWKGNPIAGIPPHTVVQQGIVHVPEGRRIFPDLTVKENLVIGAYCQSKPGKEDFDKVFNYFPEIADKMTRAGGLLSGGEQQMLAIARGLMARPEILMMDEPFMGLAPIIRERLIEIFAVLKQDGQAMLISEQNVELALEIADRGYVMETGRVALSGPAAELLKDERVVQAYFGLE
jgi:branched-chain amino acid transport system ATP-binding protein